MAVRNKYTVVVNDVRVFSGSYKACMDVYSSFMNFRTASPASLPQFRVCLSFSPILPSMIEDVDKELEEEWKK